MLLVSLGIIACLAAGAALILALLGTGATARGLYALRRDIRRGLMLDAVRWQGLDRVRGGLRHHSM
jgi:hypothetical protein